MRVRIAVAVDERGCWGASGGDDYKHDEAEAQAKLHTEGKRVRVYFVTADVPEEELQGVCDAADAAAGGKADRDNREGAGVRRLPLGPELRAE